MGAEELLEIIEEGEGQRVEFKADFAPDLGKTLCAFANTGSGTVFLGVSDEGKIRGVSGNIEEKVANHAHSCKPSIYPAIKKATHNGKLVLIVEVPHLKGVLHSFKNIAYKRVGSNDMPLSPEEVIAFARQTRIVRFDDQFCDAELEDVDEEAVRRFTKSAVAHRRLDIDPNLPLDEFLAKLELREGSHLTFAAVLLFGREPQRFALQSEVRCARFKGTEPLSFLDMKVLQGTVIEQIDMAEKFVMNHIKLEAEVKEFLREERWEYPLSAIREAITNAICHRDYFSTANVHVSVFDDRIEVRNPGELPPELTIDDLKGPHNSIPRNLLIAKALYFIKYIEHWGTGTQRMIRETLAHGLPEPEFLQSAGDFLVLFRKAEALLESLNERQKRAWEYLREEGTIATDVYIELCECSEATALRDLRDMVQKGLLRREGRGRGTRYRRLR